MHGQVMEVLKTLCEYNVKHLKGELATIKSAIMAGLNDADAEVRIAALQAVIALLISLDQKDKQHLVDCVPLMFASVGKAHEDRDDEVLASAVKELLDVARCDSTFLRPFLKDVVHLFVPIVANQELEVIRVAALSHPRDFRLRAESR
jgi:hypothetical protein